MKMKMKIRIKRSFRQQAAGCWVAREREGERERSYAELLNCLK